MDDKKAGAICGQMLILANNLERLEEQEDKKNEAYTQL